MVGAHAHIAIRKYSHNINVNSIMQHFSWMYMVELGRDLVETAVRKQIEKEEELGDLTGGSGHMGNVSYEIDSIEKPVRSGDHYTVIYHYTLYTKTEFTVYPTNPPRQEKRSKNITLDAAGDLVEEYCS